MSSKRKERAAALHKEHRDAIKVAIREHDAFVVDGFGSLKGQSKVGTLHKCTKTRVQLAFPYKKGEASGVYTESYRLMSGFREGDTHKKDGWKIEGRSLRKLRDLSKTWKDTFATPAVGSRLYCVVLGRSRRVIGFFPTKQEAKEVRDEYNGKVGEAVASVAPGPDHWKMRNGEG